MRSARDAVHTPATPSPSATKFSFWREEARRAWTELRGPGTTPKRAALSVAVGLFVGAWPVFGAHAPLLLVVCLWFQLDALVAWVASNLSNPVFAPKVAAAEVHIGAWMRGAWLALTGASAGAERTPGHHDWLGAAAIGAVLALVGGAGAFVWVALVSGARARAPYRLPHDAPDWVKLAERVASRFASPASPIARERTRFHYLRAKLLADPAPKVIADLGDGAAGGFGEVLDVGTGRGQLPMLLLELGRASRVHGIDWDKTKIADAERAARVDRPDEDIAPVAAVFTRADLRAASFEPADTVLMIDVLHYFRMPEQDTLLDRAAAAVRPTGRILVREADVRRGWRSAATLVEERVFTWLRFNRGERVCFRPARDIAARLEAAGMRCTVLTAWGKTPFSNVLVIGEKRGAPGSLESRVRVLGEV